MGTPVRWEAQWQSPLADYLADYRSLIGDQRTAVTFGEVVQGIIGAGSLVRTDRGAVGGVGRRRRMMGNGSLG